MALLFLFSLTSAIIVILMVADKAGVDIWDHNISQTDVVIRWNHTK